MTVADRLTGRELFARYAFPPNELGYCGPEGSSQAELGAHAREFDGAWPYLEAIAEAGDLTDPLDPVVVTAYWVGGPKLASVDPEQLLTRLRGAFAGQVTGLLGDLDTSAPVLAHHSFHVFVVYPWVRFLTPNTDNATPLRVLQDCRIRWGTVESVDNQHVVIASRPLMFRDGELAMGDARAERVRWRRDAVALTPSAPAPGEIVAAHWDWVCATLDVADAHALHTATQATLDLVNAARSAAHEQTQTRPGRGVSR